jgi:hypothetical protein
MFSVKKNVQADAVEIAQYGFDENTSKELH